MITLDWPSGIPEPNFQAGGVAAELDLRSACHTGKGTRQGKQG